MHVAIDIRSLMEGRHSGIEEYTIHCIRTLAKVGPRHTYHLYYNAARAVSIPEFTAPNVVIHRFRYPNKLFNAAQWLTNRPRWNNLIRSSYGRRIPIDVFFVPNVRLTPLSHDIPLVTVAHDVSFERFPEFLTLRRRLWHRIMRPRALMQSSDRIIAVSNHTKSDLVTLYDIPENKIEVIHSGINPDYHMPSVKEIQRVRRRYNLPPKFLLYFGAFEPRKNIPGIIQAWSAVAATIPHHLVLAGEAGWLEKEILEAYYASPYRERIRRLGFIPEEDKAPLFAAADIFVYPSFYEGFGFPPLEALAVGTPVITSFNSALPEIVGQWATLVDPYRTAQLAGAMYESSIEPQRMPAEVVQAVRREFSWDVAARKTLRVLESVA